MLIHGERHSMTVSASIETVGVEASSNGLIFSSTIKFSVVAEVALLTSIAKKPVHQCFKRKHYVGKPLPELDCSMQGSMLVEFLSSENELI